MDHYVIAKRKADGGLLYLHRRATENYFGDADGAEPFETREQAKHAAQFHQGAFVVRVIGA